MAKFLFVLSRGFEDPTRATRTFQLAKLAADDGNEVEIFLVDDAVMFAQLGGADNIKAPTGDELKPYLEALIEKNVPIHVCTPCANSRMISEDTLVKTAKFSTGGVLIQLAKESKVFSF